MSRCILHVDIDAFFASVEQLRNPLLRGKPVAVGSGVVASASYEARRFGLRAGMPLRQARQICPALHILSGHAPIYRCFSDHIFALCEVYSPALETYLDEAYCDWSGTERLYPNPEIVAEEIRRRVREETGLTVSAGIARNRMLAKMTSRSVKPNGLRLLRPDEEEDFICNLPVSHLPGVGPKTERLLEKLNVRTIGAMRALPRDSLQRMLGTPGLVLHDRCRGLDTQPVSTLEIPRSIRRETSFSEPTIDPGTIDGTLYYLTERAAKTLRQMHLKTRQLGVKIRTTDGWEDHSIRKLSAPTNLDGELFAAALRLLRQLHTRRVALHLVGVVLTGLVPDNGLQQLDLFDDAGRTKAQHTESQLLEQLDQIRDRYGYSAVVCGRSIQLLGKLEQDDHGFVLRTSSLTQ